jgi:hypothetical protein
MTTNEERKKSGRKYYIAWQPRGFANEYEIISVDGKKRADEYAIELSEYEQNYNSRNTVRRISHRDATKILHDRGDEMTVNYSYLTDINDLTEHDKLSKIFSERFKR